MRLLLFVYGFLVSSAAALIACAHAFIACFAIMAIGTGFHLNAGQGAIILVVTVEITTGHATAYVFVCLLVAHSLHLIKAFYRYPARLFCPALQVLF